MEKKKKRKKEKSFRLRCWSRGIFLLIINPVFDLIFTRPTTGKREKKKLDNRQKSTSWTRRGKNVVRPSVSRRRPKKNSVSQPTTHRLALDTLAAGQKNSAHFSNGNNTKETRGEPNDTTQLDSLKIDRQHQRRVSRVKGGGAGPAQSLDGPTEKMKIMKPVLCFSTSDSEREKKREKIKKNKTFLFQTFSELLFWFFSLSLFHFIYFVFLLSCPVLFFRFFFFGGGGFGFSCLFILFFLSRVRH